MASKSQHAAASTSSPEQPKEATGHVVVAVDVEDEE